LKRNYPALYLGYLADAYGQLGRVAEGLETIAEALHVTGTHTGVFWIAELHRLKGELTLAQSRVQSLGSRVKKSPKSKVQSSKYVETKSQILNPKFQIEKSQITGGWNFEYQ
jgi:ATP/maltotriose-dependent transcriptional regulator MalT